MAKFRKIGILTSGGDAPGMNAAIRAVTRKALCEGVEVVGIREGYEGLIEGNIYDMTTRDVSQIITLGGTMLYSSRSPRFATEEGMQQALRTCEQNHIDAIVALGGDGTFRGATDLTHHGIPSIGVPCTIDNDITATDATIGFDTAMNTIVGMVGALRETCESHNRCTVVEVMGRDCGEIALYTGIATGAVAVAIPECPFDEEQALARMIAARQKGKRGMIAIISEGMPDMDGKSYAEYFAELVEKRTGISSRFNRCGHIVRGGSPTLRDRLLATEMGYAAVNELLAGKSNEVICQINGAIVPVEINYSLILDRMYKNKLKDGDLDAFTAAQIEEMRAICRMRKARMEQMYTLSKEVAF